MSAVGDCREILFWFSPTRLALANSGDNNISSYVFRQQVENQPLFVSIANVGNISAYVFRQQSKPSRLSDPKMEYNHYLSYETVVLPSTGGVWQAYVDKVWWCGKCNASDR
jgi:hypothetical protein